MPDVALIPIMPQLERRLADIEPAEAHYDMRIGDIGPLAQEVVREVLRMAPVTDARFGGYLAADEDTRQVVGTCRFKGEPGPEGVVEIAFFSFPPFEGQGYATAMIEALLAIATSVPTVRLVIAHTLPEQSASTRVLEKAGLRFARVVEDLEVGSVWRWELPLVPNPATATRLWLH